MKRGLQSAEIIDRFRLGFANRTLCLHLPASNRAAGEAQRTRLKELGILRNQKPGHEHFNGSLVIPMFNLAGEVVEMYGRKITPNLRAGTDRSHVSSGAASGRVERRSADRIEGNHPVRGADRRVDVLVSRATAT